MGDGETTDAEKSIRKSVARLTAATAEERAEAAELLCRAGTAAAVAAVPLVQACGDEADGVREWVVAALEELGPPPKTDVPALATLAANAHPLVAYWAITLLGRSGADASAAAAVLAGCLESGEPPVAQRAAWALGRIGPAAGVARVPLERAAAATDSRLARLAAEALAAIGS